MCVSQLGISLCIAGTVQISEDNCFILTVTTNIAGSDLTQSLTGLLSELTEDTFTLCFKDGTGCGTANYTLDDTGLVISFREEEVFGCDLRLKGTRL